MGYQRTIAEFPECHKASCKSNVLENSPQVSWLHAHTLHLGHAQALNEVDLLLAGSPAQFSLTVKTNTRNRCVI